MTRITTGRFGGRRLVTPAGVVTRPTSERVRAAMGNTLISLGGLEGAAVLDLYAGSGAVGLELASRGAATVVLVEQDRAAVAAARANISSLAATGVTVVPATVASFVAMASRDQRFDIVVADPPYDLPTAELTVIFAGLFASGRLAPGAELIVERSSRSGEMVWPEPLAAVKTKRYGDTALCYGRAP